MSFPAVLRNLSRPQSLPLPAVLRNLSQPQSLLLPPSWLLLTQATSDFSVFSLEDIRRTFWEHPWHQLRYSQHYQVTDGGWGGGWGP